MDFLTYDITKDPTDELFITPFPSKINAFNHSYLILILALILVCCGAGGNQKNDEEDSSIRVSTGTSCLSEMTDPATWLTHAKAAELVQLPESEIRQKIYQQLPCGNVKDRELF